MVRLLALCLAFLCPIPMAHAEDRILENGEPIVDTVLAVLNPGEAVLSATQYAFHVPENASEVLVTLIAAPPTLDVDLYVRFGQRIEVGGQQGLISDYYSTSIGSGSETVAIAAASNPPLQPGVHYVGVVNYEMQDVTFALAASHDGSSATETPTVAPTPTLSATPLFSPTSAPTSTATATGTSTATQTPTPTQTEPSSPTPSPSPTPDLLGKADLDGNDRIDARDLLIFQSLWGKQRSP